MTAASSYAFALPPSDVAVVAILAVLVLLIIAVPALGALTASRLRRQADAPGKKHRRYARTMLVLWTMTALALYALALHGESALDAGLHAPKNPLWYGVALLAVAALLSLSGAGRGDISASYAQAIRFVVPQSVADWCWFVPLAASAGLCEEFLYRGYALTQIAALAHDATVGVVVSSIAFGLGHAYQGRIGMLGTAITGLLYATLFLVSGSLYPCMLAHFVQDIAGAALLARRIYPPHAVPVGSSKGPGE